MAAVSSFMLMIGLIFVQAFAHAKIVDGSGFLPKAMTCRDPRTGENVRVTVRTDVTRRCAESRVHGEREAALFPLPAGSELAQSRLRLRPRDSFRENLLLDGRLL